MAVLHSHRRRGAGEEDSDPLSHARVLHDAVRDDFYGVSCGGLSYDGVVCDDVACEPCACAEEAAAAVDAFPFLCPCAAWVGDAEAHVAEEVAAVAAELAAKAAVAAGRETFPFLCVPFLCLSPFPFPSDPSPYEPGVVEVAVAGDAVEDEQAALVTEAAVDEAREVSRARGARGFSTWTWICVSFHRSGTWSETLSGTCRESENETWTSPFLLDCAFEGLGQAWGVVQSGKLGGH